jgi:maltose O-acetyltransferase
MKKIYKSINYTMYVLLNLPYKIKYFCYKKLHDIHPSFIFNGPGSKIYGNGLLTIGANSYCGDGCSFQLQKGAKISIGESCSISHNVLIYTSNKDPLYIVLGGERKIKIADVIIGNNVWIGANVFISQGVLIGDNVVIGANSVVTKDMPSKSICAGSPCKVIKNYNV